jgi:hypothetical protein
LLHQNITLYPENTRTAYYEFVMGKLAYRN